VDVRRLARAYARARGLLRDRRQEDGCWAGELSSSALSTATSVSALSVVSKERFAALIGRAVRWLVRDQNEDGGWGDTPESPSNLSTSLLVEAALRLSGRPLPGDGRARLAGFLRAHGVAAGKDVPRALRRIYGEDRTFAVPILCNLALAGEAAGSGPSVEWRMVPDLPFELACLPGSVLGALRIHVVSYALPALIAMGRLIDCRRGSGRASIRALRRLAVRPAMRRLTAIQPPGGGFLEAVPLTAFVTMSLAACGREGHPVAGRCLEFLQASVRPDGSWPIDSNLSVWLTSLSVDALCCGGRSFGAGAGRTLGWLLDRQHVRRHPYTGSPPGGWAWTHLPGGVPDADDTSGALRALALLDRAESEQAAGAGLRWLLGLQNRDGGWPAFCRGWGRLPFDRSAPDLTAHALGALRMWPRANARAAAALRCGYDYLRRTQRPDGAWLPLWFGNQKAEDLSNPVYGTARVLPAYAGTERAGAAEAGRGVAFLAGCQNADGGWGGDRGVESSVEETAQAVCALSHWRGARHEAALAAGAAYLARAVEDGRVEQPGPIGLYFAQLWYSEALYPIIWTVAALGSALPTRRGAGHPHGGGV